MADVVGPDIIDLVEPHKLVLDATFKLSAKLAVKVVRPRQMEFAFKTCLLYDSVRVVGRYTIAQRLVRIKSILERIKAEAHLQTFAHDDLRQVEVFKAF